MTKQQMTNLIGAGTIAAIMLIIALAFGGGNSKPIMAETGDDNVAGEVITTDTALQTENAQLKEAVQVLQEREAQFTEQINLANEQLNANSYGEGEEYEEGEEEEGEEYDEDEDEDEYEED